MLIESPSAIKFFGVAGAIYLLCLALAMLFASLDIIYVSSISRFGVWLSLIYIGVVSVIFWTRKGQHEEKSQSDDS